MTTLTHPSDVSQLPWGRIFVLGVAAGLAALAGPLASVAFLLLVLAVVALLKVGLDRLSPWIPGVLAFLTVTEAPTVAVNIHGAPPVMKLILPMLAIWGAMRSRRDGTSASDLPRALFLIGLFPAAAALSIFTAVNADLAGENVLSTLGSVTLAAAIVLWVRTETDFKMLCFGLAAGAAFLGIVNATQGILSNYDNNYFGFAVPNATEAGPDEAVRVGGPFDDGNYLSQMMLMGLPVMAWMSFRARNRVVGLIATMLTASIVAAVALSFSRGGLLALGVLVMVAVLLSKRRIVWMALAAIAVMVGVAFAPPAVIERAMTITSALTFQGQDLVIEDPSARGRINEMGSAILMWRDAPVTGVGAGNYEALYLDYSSQFGLDPRRTGRSAHSFYLETAAETGVIGLGALLITIAAALAGLWSARRRLDGHGASPLRGLVTAAFLGFVAYLVAAVFLHDAYEDPFWLLIGVGLSATVLGQRQPAGRSPLRVLHVLPETSDQITRNRLADFIGYRGPNPDTSHHVARFGDSAEPLTVADVPVVPIGGSKWSRFRSLFTLTRSTDASVIHLHSERASGVVGAVGVMLGIPVILTTRADGETGARTLLRDVVNWLTVERIIRTDPSASDPQSIGRVPTELIPDVIWEPSTKARSVRELQQVLRLPNGPVVLASMPVDDAGVDVMLAAFRLVAAEYSSATLLIRDQADVETDLTAKLSATSLSPNRFRVLEQDVDVASALAISHLVIDSSTVSGNLTLIRQGLAAGLCVIATDVGETSLYVDEEYGILIEPRNPGVLARAMAFALSNPSGLMRRGQLARDRTLDRFGLRAWAERVHEVYLDVDDGRSSRHAPDTAYLLSRFR